MRQLDLIRLAARTPPEHRVLLCDENAAPVCLTPPPDLAVVLGDREAAVARELTKRFEELRRGRLEALAAHYAAAGAPRGEVVVVVGPAAATSGASGGVDALLTEALSRASLRDAVDEVTASTGLQRRQVYKRALELGRQR